VPELPEVETVARLLRPLLVGRRVTGGEVRWARTVGGDARRFLAAVRGASVVALSRRAKYLRLDLSRRGADAGAVIGHLRMSGRLHVLPGDAPAGPHLRVKLELDDGRALHFDDVRKFGRLEHVARAEERLGELGPEPLEPAFTAAWLHGALRARRRRLKPLLLDQSFLAGLGNIYVDEALFAAGLNPLLPSDRVRLEQSERLVAAIRSILARAIAREGSSFDGFYRTPEGKAGGYQEEFRVYGREGEPCRTCGEAIVRIVVGQRGTHLCPACQPRGRGARQRRSR
jgi:formamidopyrimidine-DNA glycosylase